MNSHQRPETRNILDLTAVIEEYFVACAEGGDSAATAPADTINRREHARGGAHQEAIDTLESVSPRGAERQHPFETPAKVSTRVSTGPSQGVAASVQRTGAGPPLPRDQRMVLDVVCSRLLSYTQLHQLVFPQKHRTAAGRRIRTLEARGWLRTWEERVAVGGHPRYALPTKKALLWGRRMLLDATAATPLATLAATMLRDPSPVPLELEEGIIPKQLAHQRETNDILLALRTTGLSIAWASSWHRPFPNEREHLSLPQPDAVVVIGNRLLFIEHDRGHETLDAFRAAKAERYAALHAHTDLLATLTGFHTFEVLVTINASAPLERLRALQGVVRATYGASMFRFTLYPWLLEAPGQPICFDSFARIETENVDRTAHRGLVAIPGVEALDRVSAGETHE